MSKKLNTKLIRKIARAIADEPERYNQTSYGRRSVADSEGCGTSHCIAGWAVLLERPDLLRWHGWSADEMVLSTAHKVDVKARKLLGLSKERAHRLFEGFWPDHFFVARCDDGTGIPDAEDAVALLEWTADNGRFPTDDDVAGFKREDE